MTVSLIETPSLVKAYSFKHSVFSPELNFQIKGFKGFGNQDLEKRRFKLCSSGTCYP